MPKRPIGKPVQIALVVIGVALLPQIVIFVLSVFAWSGIFFGVLFSPNPPQPEISYAEFPFEIVYEVEGETVTVNDIYVCEYEGIGMNEGVGKYREWKGYVKSTGEKKLILLEVDIGTFACAVGYPEYYMNDPTMLDEAYTPTIDFIPSSDLVRYSDEWEEVVALASEPEAMYEQYQIHLVSWKLSDPIPNSFE